ncbi:hypothetical protein THASP1DRAFT_22824 [Thamnocephalis sphaerospora]|uniref:Uncharacterized protein n=1 Tax=Thamnocephalis sphaerospora TaxID=78915 RepID=A0A4P9XTL6_9FUNG|nr:hypothetical protein THASP1DRAFT_22824 [Thamnocephalis sphaerospora]|eukprot:RKP09332.1 hypothetical protein THASP1DRAFT_22824 [Thamnocephalis sphaerospora]
MVRRTPLRRRNPQAPWSSRWTIDEQGRKTTTVTTTNEAGQAVTKVTVTDRDGRVISQTGNGAQTSPSPAPAPAPAASPPSPAPIPTPPPPPAPEPSPPSSRSHRTTENGEPVSTSSSSSSQPTSTPSSTSSTASSNSASSTSMPTPDHGIANNNGNSNSMGSLEPESETTAGMSNGAIAGLVIGILLILFLVAFIVRRVIIRRRKLQAEARFSTWAPPSMAAAANVSRGFDNETHGVSSPASPAPVSPAPAMVAAASVPAWKPPAFTVTPAAEDSYMSSSAKDVSIGSSNISRNVAGFFVASAQTSQADLRRGPVSPTSVYNGNGHAPNTPHGAAVTPVAVVAARRASTDRYRPPVGSVALDDTAASDAVAAGARVGGDESMASSVPRSWQPTSMETPRQRTYLVEEPIREEEVYELPSEYLATSVASTSATGPSLSTMMGLDRMLDTMKGPHRPADLTFDQGVNTPIGSAMPAPLLSPTFGPHTGIPPPSVLDSYGVPQHPGTARTSLSASSAKTSRDAQGRPQSGLSVMSRQAVQYEPAPQPRAPLRVINRYSHESGQ